VAPQDSTPSDRNAGNLRAAATVHLARCFTRARPVLAALVTRTAEQSLLLVATDHDGFPIAQTVIDPPRGLPYAIVIGRHNRCGLTTPSDPQVSLRHLLLVAQPGSSNVRLRGYDLGGRTGVVLADGNRVPGFSAHGQVALGLGRSALFVLPGGDPGLELLQGDETAAYRRLTGLDVGGGGQGLTLAAIAEASPTELGGYRSIDPNKLPEPRGTLHLRAAETRAREDQEASPPDQRDLEINKEQLARGLLIGRYSDRCSLAGSGRNLSRVHALVTQESPSSLLVFDLASTNGLRPGDQTGGPGHTVVRIAENEPCRLGRFQLSWTPPQAPTIH